jgi:hypothetical protein
MSVFAIAAESFDEQTGGAPDPEPDDAKRRSESRYTVDRPTPRCWTRG